MNMHGWLCAALIRASPALLAAPSGLTRGSLHPSSSSRRQHPASGSCLHSEEECEEEGAEPASPSQGFWLLEAPRHCSGGWMWAHSRAHPSAETFPSQPHCLKGGRHRGSCRTKWWSQLPTQWPSAGSTVSPCPGMELRCLQKALALPLQLQQSHCPRKLINQVLLFGT